MRVAPRIRAVRVSDLGGMLSGALCTTVPRLIKPQ